MSGYYLTEGKKEYYGEQFQNLNKRIDSFLHKIFGNFHWEGPRNWFGQGKEGDWVRFGDADALYVIPFGLILTFSLVWIYVNTNFKDIIIYISMLIGTTLLLALNYIEPKIWFEGFGAGYIKNVPRNIKIGLLLGLIFSVISIIFGILKPSEIIDFVPITATPLITFITTYIAIPLTIMLFIPYIENVTLGAFFVPSLARFMGVIPALIILSIGRGMWHLAIFHYSISLVLMSILYGFIVYPVQLAYKSKLVGWSAHSLVNTIAYALKIIKI